MDDVVSGGAEQNVINLGVILKSKLMHVHVLSHMVVILDQNWV